MQRMRLAQPRAFCGVLIKLRGPIVSFQDETYVQGLAEIWDWNFNGAWPYGLSGEGGVGRDALSLAIGGSATSPVPCLTFSWSR